MRYSYHKKQVPSTPRPHLVCDPVSQEWCVAVNSRTLSDLAALYMEISELPAATRKRVREMGKVAYRRNTMGW